MQQHPFAQYIRTLGRGKHGSRSLSQDEAFEAMNMIMEGHVEPEQLGAVIINHGKNSRVGFILQLYPVFYSSKVIAQMKLTRWPNS